MITPSTRTIGFALVAAACGLGCAKNRRPEMVDVGHIGASTDPPPGRGGPLVRGDLDALQQRGRLLHAMRRVSAVAQGHVRDHVGFRGDDVIRSLASVDPDGTSGEVLILRWPTQARPGPRAIELSAATAWLSISVVLGPDRVVDTKVLSEPIGGDDDVALRLEAMLAAEEAIGRRPGTVVFESFPVLESGTGVPARHGPNARVYCFARAVDDPDFEVLVTRPRRRRTQVEHVRAVLTKARGTAALELSLDEPSAMTVARILERDAGSGSVAVRTASGDYHIEPATGRVTRDVANPIP